MHPTKKVRSYLYPRHVVPVPLGRNAFRLFRENKLKSIVKPKFI